VNYYTGFKNIAHFRFFLDCLGQAAYHLSYKSRTLSEEDELFLCLMKLRLNKGIYSLAENIFNIFKLRRSNI